MKGAYLLVIAGTGAVAVGWCIYDLVHPELACQWLHDPHWYLPSWLFGGTFLLSSACYAWWRRV